MHFIDWHLCCNCSQISGVCEVTCCWWPLSKPSFHHSVSQAVISNVLAVGRWGEGTHSVFYCSSNYFPITWLILSLWFCSELIRWESLWQRTLLVQRGVGDVCRPVVSGPQRHLCPPDRRTLSQAYGARPTACLVGGAGWDWARATTGAKLFLKRTREDAAGVPAVDSVRVPVEPLENQWALWYQDKPPLTLIITVQAMARALAGDKQGQEVLLWQNVSFWID